PRNPKMKPVEGMRLVFGEDYYMCRFQLLWNVLTEVLKKILSDRKPSPPYLDLNWELTRAWTDTPVMVPVKYVVGNEDMSYTTPGVNEYVHGGGFKKNVPLLEEIVVMEGVGHFLNQERAGEINGHIHNFIRKFY
ncbi:unnamed protein product, partial [Linum tenue]